MLCDAMKSLVLTTVTSVHPSVCRLCMHACNTYCNVCKKGMAFSTLL